MATGIASGPDVSIIGRMLGPLIPMYILCSLLLGMRLFAGLRLVARLGWDDVAVIAALIAMSTQFALVLSAIPYGVGRHNVYVDPRDQRQASKLLFLSQFPWGWSVAFGKISIALLLLRLKPGKHWHIFLYTMAAIQLGYAACATLMPLLRCRPISAAWDYKTEIRQCLPVGAVHAAIYTNGAVAVITDIIFALIPFTFLNSIRARLPERVAILFLLGLGFFTAGIAAVKLTLVRRYGQTGDILWDSVDLVTWSLLEGQMGIIAACLPRLKSPLEKTLKHLGLLSTVDHSDGREQSDTWPCRLGNVAGGGNFEFVSSEPSTGQRTSV